jgi:hypothetical protein
LRNSLSDGVVTGRYTQNNMNLGVSTMQSGRFGFDYYLTNRNTFTLTQSIMDMGFKQNDYQQFNQADAAGNDLQYGTRLNDQENGHRNYSTQLMFKHTFPKQGKELTSDFTYNRSTSTNNSVFTTETFDPSGNLLREIQKNIGGGNNEMGTFQLDYTNPINDTARFEFGVKANYKVSTSVLNVARTDSASVERDDASLSNNYRIDDMVNAVYVNYVDMIWGIGYQAGLRFEQTYFIAELPDAGKKFEYIYPAGINNLHKALFPSLYLSKRFSEKDELQVNFSRKINRPRWRQIMPFFMFSDKKNYEIGNPARSPEFMNMMELNFNRTVAAGSWLSSAYLRQTENPITNFAYRLPTDSSILVNTYINGSTSYGYGWENTLKFTMLNKKLDLTFSGNIFYISIVGGAQAGDLTNDGYSWQAKSIASYRFPWQVTAQVNGEYEAPRIIPQGTTREQYSVDFSINKDIAKTFSFTFSVNDVFNTQRNGSFYDTPYFTQETSRRRDTRSFRLSATWRFGEWDTSLFRRKSPNRGDGGQDMPEF